MYYSGTYQSPIGGITLACDGSGVNLAGLWLESQKHGTLSEAPVPDDNRPIFYSAKKWLDSYFAGGRPKISALALAPQGSEFRRAVWAILCEIPHGELITYGDIAKKMALKTGKDRMSAQAIGGAVGHNPISIIIPCHRVVGAGGNLTGYAGGLKTKVKLLELEGVDMSGLFIPKKGAAL